MIGRKSFITSLLSAFSDEEPEKDRLCFDNIDTGDFFDSYEKCYALFAEMPLEDIVNAAKEKGIETEGRSKLEIARELFRSGRKKKRTAESAEQVRPEEGRRE